MNLAEHVRARILTALESIPGKDRDNIYVVSLYVSDTDDDPRRPTITVGYNTERRVAECTPARGQQARWPIASDAAEARWNYAFWLQNSLGLIGDEEADPVGAEMVRAWAQERGVWYSDAEEEADFEAAMARVEPLTPAFVRVVVDVVRDLHGHGDITRLFGRAVPLLIHELEYYDEIAEQNERANPASLAKTFARWVRG